MDNEPIGELSMTEIRQADRPNMMLYGLYSIFCFLTGEEGEEASDSVEEGEEAATARGASKSDLAQPKLVLPCWRTCVLSHLHIKYTTLCRDFGRVNRSGGSGMTARNNSENLIPSEFI